VIPKYSKLIVADRVQPGPPHSAIMLSIKIAASSIGLGLMYPYMSIVIQGLACSNDLDTIRIGIPLFNINVAASHLFLIFRFEARLKEKNLAKPPCTIYAIGANQQESGALAHWASAPIASSS
jgi:hypothetical protein